MIIASRHLRIIWLLSAGLALASCEAPPLTEAVLQNATYPSDSTDDGFVTLTDGRFEGPNQHLTVQLVDPISFGDLDGDGHADAVVTLATNTGGSGVFVKFVTVQNKRGRPGQIRGMALGDRVRVNDVRIDDGVIVLDITTHAEGDAMCCPTLEIEKRYAITGGALRELLPNENDASDGVPDTPSG
ncbi:MAG: hypothetical protein V3U59_10415 [Gammaproteobacteria bacterium]